jgi:hypothetical protein
MPHDDVVQSTHLEQHFDVHSESGPDDVSWLWLNKTGSPVRRY